MIAFFKEIGIFVYVAAMTKTCALFLGSVCPKWCEDVISDGLCEKIINDIFSLGNFGVKDMGRSRSGSLISEHGKNGIENCAKSYLWRQFNMSIKIRHKSLKKCKLTYPVFFVYEFFRYFFDVMRGRRPRIKTMLSGAKERKEIYEKLHIFETE